MADDDLIAAAKRGEPDAWRELHRAHAGRLLAWLATRRSGDAAVTDEDLASEAWLVAAGRINEFVGDTSGFSGWLFSIARNHSMNASRRSTRRATDPHETDEVPADTVEFESSLVARDTVREALRHLPDRERDAVGCVDGLGMDTRTAAVALGVSTTALRVARHRGLGRLRRLGVDLAGEAPVSPSRR